MKKIFLSVLAAGLLVGANSCAKCKTCTLSGNPSIKYCEKDYANKATYDAVWSPALGSRGFQVP